MHRYHHFPHIKHHMCFHLHRKLLCLLLDVSNLLGKKFVYFFITDKTLFETMPITAPVIIPATKSAGT